jgi:hypothetical protein
LQATAIAYTPEPTSTQFLNPYPHLEGLSGWLVFIGLSLVLAPIRIGSLIFTVNLPFLLDPKHQSFLDSHPATAVLVSSEVVTNSLFVLLLLFLTYLFFARKRIFPAWMIAYRTLNAGLLTINHLAFRMFAHTTDSGRGAFGAAASILGACIIIPYLLVSRRVKTTFTR